MARKFVKMVVYAEPGVGKSTFASKAPNPFFIATDGNFGWLGLPDENHVRISNGKQFEKIVDLLPTSDFDWVDTVVVDLTEDAYLMYENSFCKKHKIETIGDLDYGKGYDIVRKGFLILISKLVALPKNVIFLMHGEDDISTKDARGNVITKHVPSSKLPKKLLSSLEGKVQYFLRAYIKGETSTDPNNTKVYKKRYLSLIPKPNDFGISRGADENAFPEDIELDWDTFAEIIGLNVESEGNGGKTALQALLDDISDEPARPNVATKPNIASKPVTVAQTATKTVAPKPTVTKSTPKVEAKKEEPKEEVVEEETVEEEITLNKPVEEPVVEESVNKVSKTEMLNKLKAKKAVQEEKPVEEPTVEEKVKEEPKTVQVEAPKPSVADKLAALKALSKKK